MKEAEYDPSLTNIETEDTLYLIARESRHYTNEYSKMKPFVNEILRRGFRVKNGAIRRLNGVEIGVFDGTHAKNIVYVLPMNMLYLVDPYEYYKDYTEETSGVSDFDSAFTTAYSLLYQRRNHIRFIKMKSEEAVDLIPNNLDFVYIDGNHQYEYVKKDIDLYYPKVRSGGVIGGDDFAAEHHGVSKAVLEFADKMNLKLDGNKGEWWVVKP